jgi:hypothetical protein
MRCAPHLKPLSGKVGGTRSSHTSVVLQRRGRVWAYPHQPGAWAAVHVTKWSAWSLLVLMSFTIVTNLKHIKATVHVPA